MTKLEKLYFAMSITTCPKVKSNIKHEIEQLCGETHRQAWDKVKRAVERERLRQLRELKYTMTTLDKLQLTLSLVSDPKQKKRIAKLILKEQS